ncbi:MAG TPA: hypothetical protein VFF06_00425 [Polyangia bacterium]|nr:hypothetical protein [Polyangia bacterium]
MDRFDGFRVVRAQLVAAAERIEQTRRFWRETPAPSASHVAQAWPEAERVAERLIAAHGLGASAGARVVVRWLALNVAVAARRGWPAPPRLPRSLARDLSDGDRAALALARRAIEAVLPRALGRSPDDEMMLDDGTHATVAAWLSAQCDEAAPVALALAA